MNFKNLTMTAAAVTVAALGLVGTAPAAAHQAAPSRALGVDCDGYVHNNNPDHGIAACTNNTDRTITFRAEVVCGRAPDVSGDWVTLAPGGYGESNGICAFYSSGVGAVGWTIQ
ncbi:hypothetical protein NLX86_03805 [Streptomyces sp. A3M-1-3]|uniref:hypothetical protein n=1 Tax=Streptomyces sp. A3M-1-3 TaxID=2962044 RepID=UPI0020B7F4B3|nr:hypothetical protein [Streptomyces sp. A3M-1-3]MCP3817292.1 hypothetical protein [Streptomyces sp. A3M-1-3]